MAKRPAKKSETIEIRVSYEEKRAFMDACRDAGMTASQAIRSYIGDFLNPGGVRSDWRLYGSLLVLVLGVGAIVYAVFFAPGAPPTAGERVVRHLDLNGDGVLSAADKVGSDEATQATLDYLVADADANNDRRVTGAEIDAVVTALVELSASLDKADAPSGSAAEQVIVVPPDLPPAERKAYIEKLIRSQKLEPSARARLERLIEALTETEAGEPSSPTPSEADDQEDDPAHPATDQS